MERLVGPNYAAWASQAKKELERKGVWNVVHDGPSGTGRGKSVASPDEQSKLRAANKAIVDSLEPHVLRDVLMNAPPWNLWKVLGERYQSEPYGSVLDKAFEYFDCMHDASQESLTNHVLQMERLVETLTSMGMTLPDDVQVAVLLRSLSGVCASVVREIRQLSSPPTKAKVIEMLLEAPAEDVHPVSPSLRPQYVSAEIDAAPPQLPITMSTSASVSSNFTWTSASAESKSLASGPDFSEEIMRAFAQAMHTAEFRVQSDHASDDRVDAPLSMMTESLPDSGRASQCQCPREWT